MISQLCDSSNKEMDEEWLKKFYADQGKLLLIKVGNKMASLPGFNKNTTNYV
jgi:hypothetical protein